MTQTVDGNKIAKEIFAELKHRVDDLKAKGFVPRLIVFLIGRDPASAAYVRMKQKRAEELGLAVEVKKYGDDVAEETLLKDIKETNRKAGVSGILIQLPLPDALNRDRVLDAVSPELDVDCLTEENQRRLIEGEKIRFIPPAAGAVLEILKYHQIDLKKGNVVIVGSGDLVGKPLAALFLKEDVAFKLANRFTENLAELTLQADVVITGVGRPGLITADMVKDGAVIIDAGTAGTDAGELKGDVDFEAVAGKAGLITPVPGGVGPLTVAMLLKNLVDSASTAAGR